MSKPVKKGRPQGSRNREVDVVQAAATRCKKCGSTARSVYNNRRVMEVAGLDERGQPYSRVVWRRCRCEKCGQWRDDVSREV